MKENMNSAYQDFARAFEEELKKTIVNDYGLPVTTETHTALKTNVEKH